MKPLLILLLLVSASGVYAQQSEHIEGLHPRQKPLNIYIPTLDQMKYKSTAVMFGMSAVEFSVNDTLASSGGGVIGGMTAKVSTGFIAKRVSVEISMGYLFRPTGINGWVGLGLNTRIKDWNIIDEERENASLIRFAMNNDIVFAQNLKNTKELDVINRLKHVMNVEWLLYKRNQSIYFGLGYIGSPYENFSYKDGAVVFEIGIKLFTAHNKGAFFERKPFEMSKVILPDNNY